MRILSSPRKVLLSLMVWRLIRTSLMRTLITLVAQNQLFRTAQQHSKQQEDCSIVIVILILKCHCTAVCSLCAASQDFSALVSLDTSSYFHLSLGDFQKMLLMAFWSRSLVALHDNCVKNKLRASGFCRKFSSLVGKQQQECLLSLYLYSNVRLSINSIVCSCYADYWIEKVAARSQIVFCFPLVFPQQKMPLSSICQFIKLK